MINMVDRNIGRNDPCWCGSGQKYKKCHMAEDKAAERERVALANAGKWLQRDLFVFSQKEEFAPAIAAALTRYWNGLYDMDNMEEMSEMEALRFFDWFMFDYRHEGQPRLLEQYQTARAADLSAAQQQVLESWLQADPAGGYELTGYDEHELQLRDFLTGEETSVVAAGGRGNVEVGEVILGRILTYVDKRQFSTTAAYIPRDEMGDIVAEMTAAKDAYLVEHPAAGQADFMRAENVRLIHHALAQSEAAGRPPVARLDPNRDDGAMRQAARLIARRMTGRRR
jgi:hypothetical protein